MGFITQNAPFCPNTEYPLLKLGVGCGHFCHAVNTLAPNCFYDNCRHWFFQCPWPMSNFLAAYTMLAHTKKYGWCGWSCCILYSSTTISWQPMVPNLPEIRLKLKVLTIQIHVIYDDIYINFETIVPMCVRCLKKNFFDYHNFIVILQSHVLLLQYFILDNIQARFQHPIKTYYLRHDNWHCIPMWITFQ